jgi:molecular chaperone GrpE
MMTRSEIVSNENPMKDAAVEAEIVQTEGATEALNLGIDLPEDSDEAVRLLLTKLEESRDEATSYLDDLQRVAADFDNYRKRTIREQSTLVDRAAERLVVELMPVLDTFDAAVASEAGTDSERQLMSGMLNTREQLLKALESEGLEVITSIGEPFDPEVHEPVGAPGGSGALIVSQELRRGYKLKGRVLRAALVVLENSK